MAWAGVTGVLPTGLHAAEYQIPATDWGWFRGDGYHVAANRNYATGEQAGLWPPSRSFFLFDLSGLQLGSGEVVSGAAMSLTTYAVATSDPSETLGLFDVTTDAGKFMTDSTIGSSDGIAVYDDLGTGVSYGEQVYVPADSGPNVRRSIELNSEARTAIQAAMGGYWAMGGTLVSLDGTVNTEIVFGGGNTVPNGPVLTIRTVPEPSAAVLGLCSIWMVSAWTSRRKSIRR